jgi:hypothetical protein
MQNEHEDWRALSKAASQEQDPDKLLQLIERLNDALVHHDGQNNNGDALGDLMTPGRYSRI